VATDERSGVTTGRCLLRAPTGASRRGGAFAVWSRGLCSGNRRHVAAQGSRPYRDAVLNLPKTPWPIFFRTRDTDNFETNSRRLARDVGPCGPIMTGAGSPGWARRSACSLTRSLPKRIFVSVIRRRATDRRHVSFSSRRHRRTALVGALSKYLAKRDGRFTSSPLPDPGSNARFQGCTCTMCPAQDAQRPVQCMGATRRRKWPLPAWRPLRPRRRIAPAKPRCRSPPRGIRSTGSNVISVQHSRFQTRPRLGSSGGVSCAIAPARSNVRRHHFERTASHRHVAGFIASLGLPIKFIVDMRDP